MKEFNSVEEILDFAIMAEQEAVDFYTDLAARSKSEPIKKVFVEFAGEEMKHKSRLMGIKEEKSLTLPGDKVRDMKIADYLVDVVPSPDMTYAEALIIAMKKEKKAKKKEKESLLKKYLASCLKIKKNIIWSYGMSLKVIVPMNQNSPDP